MTRYAYVAAKPDGSTKRGTTRAESREEAELALYERELRNIRLSEKPGLLQLEITARRVKREEVMHLTRQLGAFVGAGLPLTESVHSLGREAENSSVRRMMLEVEDGLRDGERLSDCFDRHPRIFPEFYRGILRSAELSGRLDTALGQLARYLERDLEARRRIKQATIYPAVVAAMSVVTLVVLAGFVLPRFQAFFDSLGARLPLPTRILLAITNFLTGWWWALMIGLGVLTLLLVYVLSTTPGRYLRDRLVLAVPVIGPTVQFALVERFCRILSSMVSAGVQLPQALRVATGSLPNRVYRRSLAGVMEAMLQGEGLARPLAATKLFPATAAQMIRVGEDTGTMDAQLEVTAQYYEGELDYKLKKLIGLFEPAVIVLMGGVVGFVAIALVSAMYGIFRQVQG
ncbi:type IV pilus assembly protein PilC [Kribbella rubisoli]|jgi:type IV pilus assembly protein PilC|uniref:Type IV pilus assembly protein PilC n=1 Tax=Kribbella rubisoli TaxID=3075929 RepID=A0A4Q7X7E7_9ACTN|nr:type II secretion system F family protein [Kribbella rubisoli]RZU18613.1 type IV pilus assembly protein PilC [Kribbella rubisoli]